MHQPSCRFARVAGLFLLVSLVLAPKFARATALVGGTTLTVPYPTPATALTPNLPGLSVGPVAACFWPDRPAARPLD